MSTHSANQIAGPCTRRNAGGALTDDSGTSVPIPAIFYAFSPALASNPGPLGRYTEKDL